MNTVKSKAKPIWKELPQSSISQTPSAAKRFLTLGAVDLHFHGAFGIDVMTATAIDLSRLSRHLFQKHVAAFLPTTISASIKTTEQSLARLGAWIRQEWSQGPVSGKAFPLGIHLEGPFISRGCCGAHPQKYLIPPSIELLERWWNLSNQTLARITLAPETTSWSEVQKILTWAKRRQITISLGHSQTPSELAEKAFRAGASCVTHAWNAMPFHHRNPGILGQVLGRKNRYIELIPDGIHVSDIVTSWTQQLHPKGICWVSDAVPAAHRSGWHAFGPLQVRVSEGAGRTSEGHLAGGGLSLAEMFRDYWRRQMRRSPEVVWATADQQLKALTLQPLQSQAQSNAWISGLNRTHVWEYTFGRQLQMTPHSGPNKFQN